MLIFQLALIPGSILVGFLLSPLLYLSRHIARRPLRKLRFPEEKQTHKRLLALGFYLFAALIVGGPLGLWTRWCLGGRDPWMWTLFWILEGQKKWSRPLLLAYWALLVCISVAGWGRQLYRSRRFRQKTALQMVASVTPETMAQSYPTSNVSNTNGNSTPPAQPENSPSSAISNAMTNAQTALGLQLSLPTLPNFPHSPNVSVQTVASDWLDAADKRIPTLSLNARRKFFHALAVAMFVPGIALDVRPLINPTT